MSDDDHAGAFPGGREAAGRQKAEAVTVPATGGQVAYLAGLRRRARACRDGLVAATVDNMLEVLTSERLASLDMRLVGQPMDGPGKIAAAADQIANRMGSRGLQVVFCETGIYRSLRAVPPPGVSWSWSIRSELVDELAAQGVPGSQVWFAVARELRKPGAAEELAALCQQDKVRVLVSSTHDIRLVPGLGDLVTAAHHLDVPFDAAGAARRTLALTGEGRPGPWQLRYCTTGYTEAAGWRALSAGRGPVEAAQAALAGAAGVPAVASRPGRRPRPRAAPRRGPRGPSA